ncbi:MAG TPA: orotate phosphoribosyltransferase [Firmicutes bacterium]|nr:orotate phosphoribosyltransferase [Bacillota bacterium]
MRQEEAVEVLKQVGAFQTGHFVFSSGLHSSIYVEKFRILERPLYAERLCRELAERFSNEGVSCVAGPTMGGIIVAYEVARHLPGARAIFAERDGDGREFRRGFAISPGERVLVVEDVITTGGSARQVIDAVERHGGVVVGVGALVDRSGGAVSFPFRFEPIVRLSLEAYDPSQCPLCKSGVPLEHPGSSPVPHTGASPKVREAVMS